jgi:hypothetical protein
MALYHRTDAGVEKGWQAGTTIRDIAALRIYPSLVAFTNF